MQRLTKKLTPLGMAMALACLPGVLVLPAPASAQETTATAETRQPFNIPAGPLTGALNRLAKQAGLALSYDPALAAGKTADGLQGEFTPAEALQRLLAGSGLTYRFTGVDTVTLAVAPPGDGPMRVRPIQVMGALVGTRIGETAEGSSASVQVFTAEALEEQPGAEEVRDLYNKTTNVVDFGPGVFAPAVRGVDGTGAASGGLGFIAGTRPRTTLTVDGRPLSAFELVGSPTALWDVKQVEIYRGPQTTLQGRNSIAGAFVVETNDPSFIWESKVRAMAGTEDRYRTSAMVSGPVAESLAFRATVDHFHGESFVDFLGPQGVDDIEDDESLTVRGKLMFAPDALSALTAQLTLAHTDTRRPQSQLSDPPFDRRERQVSQTAFETRSTDVILDLDYVLSDGLTLSNTASYSDIVFNRVDAPANGQFEFEGPQFTNETRLNLKAPGDDLKGVVGLYVFHEDRDDAGFIGTPLSFTFDDETLTTAVFGELEWAFAGGLRATLGGRYEREERLRQGSAFGIDTDLDETFDAFLPKAGISWDLADQVTVGAVVSRGFNAGGGSISFGASDADGNPSPDPALGPRSFVFDSEFVWNYEFFARARLLDEQLFLSGNIFFSDFKDQQRVEQIDFPGGFIDSIIVNTPETQSYGAELGIEYTPSDRWDVFANIGLLHTGIEQARDPRIRGNDFARAPNLTTNFGVNLRPTADWHVGLDARYTSEYFSTDLNNTLTEVDDTFIANATVSWRPLRYARVFGSVTNLFDSDAERRLFSFPATAPPSLANVVEPRVLWLGVELSFE